MPNKPEIEIRGMRPDEVERVHLMLARAFPHTPKSFFDKQVQNDPFLQPEDTRILLANGVIQSCVRVYSRNIYCGGEKLKMGGIGDVGTDPPACGRGYATRLMNDAIGYMKSRKTTLSILFTRINTFYEKAGYFTLPTLHLSLKIPVSIKTISYRKVNLKQDIASLVPMYNHLHQNRWGPVVRNKKYWRCQMGFPRLDPELFWISEENGKLCCYIRGFVSENILKILELGCIEGEEERLRCLVATMAHTVQTDVVQLSYVSQREVALFRAWSPEVTENTALMIRLLQLDRLSSFSKLFQKHQILFWESDRF